MLRRSFLTGLVSVLAAPAIVRAESLMPVKALLIPPRDLFIRKGVIDRLTGLPVNLLIKQSDYDLVLAGTHMRYSKMFPPIVLWDRHAFTGLDVSEPQVRQDFSFIREG